jgi:Dipeptidyl peptidase IV (DPP IV) N-terminal region.
LISEWLNTYVEYQPLRLLSGGREMIWWSERDGWGHYYLYDSNGQLKNQITRGEFNCQGVVNVDEKNPDSLFYGLRPGKREDPYYTHLYRIKLDAAN